MRQSNRLIYGIFISIGIALLLLASILRFQGLSLPSDIALNVGMVVLSLALIDFLWKIVGGDPLSQEISQLKKMNLLNQDAAMTGLSRVIAKADNTEREMLTSLYKNSRQLIDISGWTLKTLIENKDWRDSVAQKVEKGVTVRILLYDPANEALKHVMNDDDTSTNIAAVTEEMKLTWNRFQQLKGSLPENAQSRFHIKRLRNEVMYCSIRRIDELMYVIPYSYELSTSESPVYFIQGSNQPLFQSYMREFDCLFERGLDH